LIDYNTYQAGSSKADWFSSQIEAPSTLYQLGIYTNLGQPNGNAEVWQQNITA
jgi:hypothetical protein